MKSVADDATVAYQTAISLYQYEGTQVWARYNAFLVVHGLLLAAITLLLTIDSASANFPQFRLLPCLLSLIGMAVSFLWLSITIRGFSYHDAFLQRAREIEEKHLSVRVYPIQPVMMRGISRLGETPIRQSAYMTIGVFVLIYVITGLTGLFR